MLHLLPGLKVVLPHGRCRLVPNPVSPTKRGKRGIGNVDALRDQLFVHADQIAAAARVQLDDVVTIRLGLLGPLKPGHHRRAGVDDRPDSPP